MPVELAHCTHMQGGHKCVPIFSVLAYVVLRPQDDCSVEVLDLQNCLEIVFRGLYRFYAKSWAYSCEKHRR